VQFESQAKQLTVVTSDCECKALISALLLTSGTQTVNLVNRDQLDILATLRESVNEDKKNLEADAERLKSLVKELGDKNRMQLEQVNSLLLEKVSLQSESIGQREKMLQRERDFGQAKKIYIEICFAD
jgi:protein HOOK3